MALETYRAKRDFKATPEPRGACKVKAAGHSFVIQKHAARRLHYDFRLEMDGVLKSWAVTRGPSLIAGEKRLAVHVEDHPLAYGDFEGTIPKGEYGGGSVIVWDRGHWSPLGDARKGYAKGHLDFELHGEKLGGRWHLVRMAGRRGEKRENWLLIKGDDDAARAPGAADILDERPGSVKTGRAIGDLAGEPPGWSSKRGKIERAAPPKGARKAALPRFVAPALATLAAKPPKGARWLHEIKFDGYRLQARIEAGRVKLLTRAGLDWSARFGKSLTAALGALPAGKALIDGELVVENDSRASDFSVLQADLSEGRADRFVYYAFDLLHLDGHDFTAVPLHARKERLAALIAAGQPAVRYSEHFTHDGDLILRHACRLSLEGIVSKLRDAPYRSGRTKAWVKSKCSVRQEFVIGGYVPSTTARNAIGSLVLGYYRGKSLVHAGRVGTGFTAAVAEDLHERLERLQTKDSPFVQRLDADAARQVRFVEPRLVAEVEFRGWTAADSLRHAAFRGLREDKPATEVVREQTARPPAPHRRSTVELTHPDRLYWPESGVTKQGLADYYAEVWPRIAPFIVARPLSLLRCPDGIAGQCFFQKHPWKGASTSIKLAQDPEDKAGMPILTIEDLDGLLALVQSGVLEIHPWGATVAALEQPDIIVMDLDPGEGVPWSATIAAAREVRDRLERLGLAGFVKTSGGKGLHVVVPLKPKARWPEVKAFAKAIADAMAVDDPAAYVATISKSKRRGRILIDYLRNGRGATAVAPYSTRAREGAPVAMPIGWDELGPTLGPAAFTVANAPARLASLARDPWADFRRSAAPLPTSGLRPGR